MVARRIADKKMYVKIKKPVFFRPGAKDYRQIILEKLENLADAFVVRQIIGEDSGLSPGTYNPESLLGGGNAGSSWSQKETINAPFVQVMGNAQRNFKVSPVAVEVIPEKVAFTQGFESIQSSPFSIVNYAQSKGKELLLVYSREEFSDLVELYQIGQEFPQKMNLKGEIQQFRQEIVERLQQKTWNLTIETIVLAIMAGFPEYAEEGKCLSSRILDYFLCPPVSCLTREMVVELE